ncbi:MAG: AarF/ABC1/UbiB kinase family protein [Desulfobacterales bacterium]|nr:MAG: AarF/ABC1/UbiB kinase family protein [Desulfobacterales bacterium]
MKSFGRPHRVKGLKRLGVIVRVLIKHGLGDLADRLFGKPPKDLKAPSAKEISLKSGYPSPDRIRRVLEELGPSFIKLGQLMSTRADIFPPEYLEELRKLQDRVPPVAFPAIQKVIEAELKNSIDTAFSEFAEESTAAASVAQVHTARLTTGEKVAVKVVRPGIGRKIADDIRLMYYFAAKIEKTFEIARMLSPINLVQEFERTIFKELDMLIEAGSMEKFAAHFKDVDEIYIPRVYWEYTSKSVLVMEHIDGIKMDQVQTIIANGIDPKEVALIGLRCFSRQLMDFGFFHADPHPGNAIVMYDGRVSIVDFGITGYLDEEAMLQIANIFLGYAEHDYDMVMGALREAGLIDENTVDLGSFKTDLKDMSEPFYGRSLQTISVKEVYDQVMQLVFKYHIKLPRNLLLLVKTLIQTEALGKILGSDASILEVTRPYAKALLKRGYDAQKIIRNLSKEARYWGGHMKMVPKYVHDILKQAAAGKPRVEIRHSGFEGLDTKLEKGINRLTVGLVISASIIAASLILNSSQKVMEFTVDFFGVRTISITAILGLIGYSLATVLGFWLIISIFRSGKM